MVCSSLVFTGCDDDLILVTGVDLYTNEIHANVNDSVDLSYKVYPSNASNKKVTFWSTDDNIASVDENGKVTIKSTGEASIVVRSVDGGYEDYCKIVTNIDPDKLSWDYGEKIIEAKEPEYSATTSMALNQVMKLKVRFLLDGVESDLVTNRDVVFTSSNPRNIQVINEKEGIIKACHDAIVEGERAFSDITATLKTKNGELKTTCRVYINKCSSQEYLFVQYQDGGTNVLSERNGSEIIYLTSSGSSVDFYTFITNETNEILDDYDIEISNGAQPGSTPLFTVQILSSENGITKFRLTPSEDEGTGTLYIKTTCSDESGKTIRANVNVTIQAEIKSAEATATNRNDGGIEVLLSGEIFSIGLEYFDAEVGGKLIEGAKRDIYFEELNDTTAQYVSYYGNNQFKIKKVPSNPKSRFVINGYIYVENVDSSARINFEYEFYIRNALESLMVSTEPREGNESITSIGISDVTLQVGGIQKLYAYATTYDFSMTEPARVSMTCEDEALVSAQTDGGNMFMIEALKLGDSVLIFRATDGIETIEYRVQVHVVTEIAKIEFYENYNNGFEDRIDDTYTTSEDTVIIYLAVVPLNDNIIENESNILLSSSVGTIKTLVDVINLRVYRCIEIDVSSLSSGQTLQVEVSGERILTEKTLEIVKN